MLRLTLLLLVGALIYWYLPGLQEAIETAPEKAAEQQSRLIELSGVTLTSYGRQGELRQRLQGEKAHLALKLEEGVVEPASFEAFRDGAVHARLTGRVARKGSSPEGQEQLEFEGNVVGWAADGKQLVGELIRYFPKDQRVMAPTRATLIATDTQVSGDSLEMNLAMERGYARENVEIVHWEAARGGARADASQPRPRMVILGREAVFDLEARHHRIDHDVRVTRSGMTMTGRHLEFYQEQEKLVATGQVGIRNGEIEIECERLDHELATQRSLATGTSTTLPHLRYLRPGHPDVQELWARSIRASLQAGQKWLQGDQEVRFLIYQRGAGGEQRQLTTVTSDHVDAFYERGRATFTGDVQIRSDGGGAKGRRAVYYRETERIHITGEAEAWEIEAGGRETRRVQGEHIRYHLQSGNAVVLGGVRGYLPEGQGAR